MTSDLSVYSFHPARKHELAAIVVIIVMAIFGFIRGLMGAADLVIDRPTSGAPTTLSGKPAQPIIIPDLSVLTPKVIAPAQAPKPSTAATNTPVLADAAATNAPVITAPKIDPAAKTEAAPLEAAPGAPPSPPPRATPAAPPPSATDPIF